MMPRKTPTDISEIPTEIFKIPTEIPETVGVFSGMFSGFIIRFPFHRDHGPHFACSVAEVAGDEGELVVADVVPEAALPAATGAGETAGVTCFRPRPVSIRFDFQYVFQLAHWLPPLCLMSLALKVILLKRKGFPRHSKMRSELI